MKRAQVLRISAVALLAASVPAGCRKDRPAGQVVVGLSNCGAESGWHNAFIRSLNEAAGQQNIDLQYADGQQKQENQIKAVRAFIAQQVDAIVLVPIVETGWEPVLREAKRANIPVILVGRGIESDASDLYVTLIASDFVEEGRMAGEWLAKRTGRKAKIVELQGLPGAAPAIDRHKGFVEVIDKHPGMTIVRSQSGDFTRAKGKEVMESFIKSLGDDIDAVYAHNDDMALGAIQALEESGHKPGTDVLLISIDAIRPAFEAMVAGKLNATVECTPMMGPIIFETVKKVLAGESVPRFLRNHDRLFDQTSAKDAIDKRPY